MKILLFYTWKAIREVDKNVLFTWNLLCTSLTNPAVHKFSANHVDHGLQSNAKYKYTNPANPVRNFCKQKLQPLPVVYHQSHECWVYAVCLNQN